MDILTREDAIKLGVSRYFTGVPCKHGHLSERYITRRCVECHAALYRAHPERRKLYRANNLERCLIQSRMTTKKWRRDYPEKMLLAQIKTRCKRHNITCTITVDDIKFPTHCPILGIPLFIGIGEGQRMDGPSVDRIIPTLGYIPSNVQVVSKLANTMKNAGTLQDCVKLGLWAQQMLDSVPPPEVTPPPEKKEE